MNGNCGNQNNVYIGARYVPKIVGEWSADIAYEPLTVVLYQGTSYTSITYVPKGIIPSENTQQYWALTGNYNAQVEMYRQEVNNYKNDVDTLKPFIERTYATTILMLQDKSLNNGSYVETLGYYNINDGGGAKFLITNIKSNEIQFQIKESLYATLIVENSTVNILSVGAQETQEDNYSFIEIALNYANNFAGTTVLIPKGIYLIGNTLKIPNKTVLEGIGSTSIANTIYPDKATGDVISCLKLKSRGNCNMIENLDKNTTTNIMVKNLYLHGNNENQSMTNINCINFNGDKPIRSGSIFENIVCYYANGDGIYFGENQSGCKFTNVWAMRNNGNGFTLLGDDYQCMKWGAGNNSLAGLSIINGKGTLRSFDSDFFGNNQGVVLGATKSIKMYNAVIQNNQKEGLYLDSSSFLSVLYFFGGYIGNNSIETSGGYSEITMVGKNTPLPLLFNGVQIGNANGSNKVKYLVEDNCTSKLNILLSNCDLVNNNANEVTNTSSRNFITDYCQSTNKAIVTPLKLPSTKPSAPMVGDSVINYDTYNIDMYNGTNWVGKYDVNYNYRSSNYTLTLNDFFLLVNGEITITLPVEKVQQGRLYIISTNSTQTVTFKSSVSISGKTTLTEQYGKVVCIFTGTSWYII